MSDTTAAPPPPPPVGPPSPYAPPAPVLRAPKPPRKWLGPKGGWLVFLAFMIPWAINLILNAAVLHTSGVSPNIMILGGFGMTAALLYTLAYRVRAQDGLTPMRLVLAFVLGGLLSTELAVWIEATLESIPFASLSTRDVFVRSLAGVIEEACKLLAVVILARGLTQRTARNGLFLGGAVGLGFAAFEDMKYALAFFDHPMAHFSPIGGLITVTLGRDAIGPFEHPIFTSLLAAVLFAATRDGKFRITWNVVGAYLLIAAGHGLIDASPEFFYAALHNRVGSEALGILVGLAIGLTGSLLWLRYSRRLRAEAFALDLAEFRPPA